MAGSAVIGALRVVIGADSAALDKGLKDAQSSLARFSSSMKNVGLVAAGALAGLVGGTAVAIKKAVDNADQLNKLSQSVGLTVEELGKLRYAGELSDVSLEELGKSLVKLSKAMSEVAAKGTGPAAEAFKALGVSVTNSDGTMKSSGVVLEEIADKFATYRDGANKTALAVAIFGRAGANMIPMLNQGSAALREAGQEAQQFGLIIDKQTAVASENFNDNLTRLGKVSEGVSVQLAARLSPAMAQISSEFVDAAKNSQTLIAISSGLEVAMKSLATAVLGAVYAYKQFTTYFKAVLDAALKVAGGDFAGAFDTLKQGLADASQTAAETYQSFQRLWTAPDTSGVVGALNEYIVKAKEAQLIGQQFLDAQKRDAPALSGGGAAKTDALQNYLSGIEKRKAALTAELQTIGLSEAAQESLRIKLEALTIAKEKDITVSDAMRMKIEQTSQSFGALAQAVQDARERWEFISGSINTVASGLTDVLMGAKTAKEAFRDMAVSIIRDFTQMIIKAQLFRLVSSFIPGGGAAATGANLLTAVAGARAAGGPVSSGSSYLVGEMGPELFTPSRAGQIIPNSELDGAGSGRSPIQMTNNWTNVSPDMKAYVDRAVNQMGAAVLKQVPGMLQRRRGGDPNLYGPA